MSNVLPFAVFTLDRLNITAPPRDIFETLLGYTGKQRFIGFCYSGHTLSIEDGQFNEIGNRRAWSIWYRSMGVQILKRYCFGYEGRAPEHMLVLDRVSRALYAGPVLAAQTALRQQIPLLLQTAIKAPSGEDRKMTPQDLGEKLFDVMPQTNSDCQVEMVRGIKKLEMWVNVLN